MTDEYAEALATLESAGLHRRMASLDSPAGRLVRIGSRELLCFCSNNYLGLANHPAVVVGVRRGLARWGWGAGGSRLICGNTDAHEHLQQRLANLLGKEASLVLPSGYGANTAVLSTLMGRGDLIALDKLVHASLIDGARASGAQVRIWPHRQTDKLRRLLERGGYRRAIIVTDSLFSMDGDFADLADLVDLKRQFGAMLMVDEAHAFGCVGPDGRGWASASGVLDEVDLFVGTFSKALGGAGGFVAGPAVLMEYLVNKARPFIYTTALPGACCVGAEAALDVVASEPLRRERLEANAKRLREHCRTLGLDTAGAQGYIVPIILGSAEATTAAAAALERRGYMVWPIRPPTVAPGGSRLRLSLMSDHTDADIDGLAQALGQTCRPGHNRV